MSDRIVVMNLGRIEQVGTPKDLYFSPRTRFVAGFFGDNNLISGTVSDEGHVDSSLGTLPVAGLSGLIRGEEVLVAIRPESLRLGKGAASIQAVVTDSMFGGALTKLLLRPTRDQSITLDLRLSGLDRGSAPSPGDSVSVTYDPADAVVIADRG